MARARKQERRRARAAELKKTYEENKLLMKAYAKVPDSFSAYDAGAEQLRVCLESAQILKSWRRARKRLNPATAAQRFASRVTS